jgi:hypothetical protein
MFEEITRPTNGRSIERSRNAAAYVANLLVAMRTAPLLFDYFTPDELRQMADQAARLHVAADQAHQAAKAGAP